jgi:DNA-binding winged helix-turn-helix (wHTH) protein/tetratricopeptide (TPR) repeat protein
MGDGAIGEPVVLARVGRLHIGSLLIEPADCVVRDEAGQEEALEPRVMQVLVVLVRAEGAPVSRGELIASCWGGRIVSNDAVTRVISILRKLAMGLGGGSFEVETLNKVGYRLRAAPAPTTMPAPVTLPHMTEPEQKAFASNRRSLLTLGVGGLAMIGAGWWITRPNATKRAVSAETTLAVVPFTADAADRDLVQIARGTGDAIRNDLGRVPGLQLTDHASARSGRSMADAQAGPAMALAASLERRGDDLHLIMTLTDPRSGDQLWSAAIDGPRTNPSDLARDAAGAVIEHLVLLLPAAAWPRAAQSLRSDPEAYRLSTEARSLCDDVRERLLAGQPDEAQHLADRAAALVTQALAINPEHPDALVVLAQLTRNGWSQALAARKLTTQQRVEQARALLRRALRSDPRNAGAMTGLADIYRRFGWRWDDADILFRHALANDPINADAHWSYSHELVTLGRARDGLDQVCALLAIDHTHLWRRITLPRMLYCFGARDRALAAYYRELGALPGNPFLLWEIYYLFVAEGSGAGLSDFIERLERTGPEGAMSASVEAIIARARAALDGMAGRPAALLAILDAERNNLDTNTLTHATLGGRARDDLGFILAIEYAHAGQYDRAIALLDQALAAMSVYWVPSLPFGNAPFPPAMQKDPRFQALWKRDPRLADAVERRQQAASTGQMATALPDGSIMRPEIDSALDARIEAALMLLPPGRGMEGTKLTA